MLPQLLPSRFSVLPPAADWLAVALIGFACCAFALALRGGITAPGSATTAGYPFHDLLFTRSMPNMFDLAAAGDAGLRGVLVPMIGLRSGLARRR